MPRQLVTLASAICLVSTHAGRGRARMRATVMGTKVTAIMPAAQKPSKETRGWGEGVQGLDVGS